MAVRPVFVSRSRAPFFIARETSFLWHSGFAVSQKQKNIRALHESFISDYPGKKVLEISSRSFQTGGKSLSAFFLEKFVPSLGKSLPVENIFQAAKVFASGGPYTDLLNVSPREAKQDERLRSSGRLLGFTFEGQEFPLLPKTVFYDYIYINALLENEAAAAAALSFDAFTDIEFNPAKSLNCQARAAAIFVSLYRLGKIDEVRDFERFRALFTEKDERSADAAEDQSAHNCDKNAATHTAPPYSPFMPGDRIEHQKWGVGEIISAEGESLTVRFSPDMEKLLGTSWVNKNCRRL